VAEELRRYQGIWAHCVRRSRRAFNTGLVSFLLGAAVLLLPEDGTFLDPLRIAAVVILAGAALTEAVATLGDTRLARRTRWLRWSWRVSGWVSAVSRAERERVSGPPP
jgi:drug/metabolite transporter (DMT)-like permease